MSCNTRLKQDWEPFHREWHRVYNNDFVRVLQRPRESSDQVMKDHENLYVCELVARTHPLAPTEWNKCERLRTGSFKPRRIEPLRLLEILRVPVSRVHRPVNLLCAGKQKIYMHDGIRSD